MDIRIDSHTKMPIEVIPGATYIIDKDVQGDVVFEADPHDPTPVDFNIELDESPSHDHDVKIKIGGHEGLLSPTLTVAEDYNGPKTSFDFKKAADTDFSIGKDSLIKKLEVSEKGEDNLYVGAFDRSELSKSGKLELDGNGPKDGSPADTLSIDLSWLDPDELKEFKTELENSGYEKDGSGGWTFVDANGDGKPDKSLKVTLKIDTNGDGKDDFSLKLHHWENINIVCFARGTRIVTQRGEVPIERLSVGELVLTMDSGFQPIRWIGSSKVPGRKHLAPIRIKAGTFHNTRDVVVSPQHRILMKGSALETHFGQTEALVAAKHLVDGEAVVVEEVAEMEYFHMLFERHEIVYAEGMPSESFHPGAFGLDSMAEATRREIFELFPELEADVSAYGASCRTSLKSFEARTLVGGRRSKVATAA